MAITTGSPGTLTTDFEWTRVGLTAVILTSNGTVTDAAGNSDSGGIGAGTAAFAPLIDTGNTCPEGDDLTAQVVGALVLADGS